MRTTLLPLLATCLLLLAPNAAALNGVAGVVRCQSYPLVEEVRCIIGHTIFDTIIWLDEEWTWLTNEIVYICDHFVGYCPVGHG